MLPDTITKTRNNNNNNLRYYYHHFLCLRKPFEIIFSSFKIVSWRLRDIFSMIEPKIWISKIVLPAQFGIYLVIILTYVGILFSVPLRFARRSYVLGVEPVHIMYNCTEIIVTVLFYVLYVRIFYEPVLPNNNFIFEIIFPLRDLYQICVKMNSNCQNFIILHFSSSFHS